MWMLWPWHGQGDCSQNSLDIVIFRGNTALEAREREARKSERGKGEGAEKIIGVLP